jgi:hypothetical protein
MPIEDARMYQSCNLLIPAMTFLSFSKVSRGLLDTYFRHIFIICLSWLLYLYSHYLSLFCRLIMLDQINCWGPSSSEGPQKYD